jgi:hypothetical protein
MLAGFLLCWCTGKMNKKDAFVSKAMSNNAGRIVFFIEFSWRSTSV